MQKSDRSINASSEEDGECIRPLASFLWRFHNSLFYKTQKRDVVEYVDLYTLVYADNREI